MNGIPKKTNTKSFSMVLREVNFQDSAHEMTSPLASEGLPSAAAAPASTPLTAEGLPSAAAVPASTAVSASSEDGLRETHCT